MCSFFTDVDMASLPYPEDITVGPVQMANNATGTSNSEGTSDLAQVINLLNSQKADSDKRMAALEQRINSLVTSGSSNPSPSNTPQGQANPTPGRGASNPRAPQQLVRAAANLQSFLNDNQANGNAELTMDQLRSNGNLLHEANRQLDDYLQNVTPLSGINPLENCGDDASSTFGQPRSNQVSTIDQLYAATVQNKQLQAGAELGQAHCLA